MYDPQIGRWHMQDPNFGKYKSISPYSYAACNPILNIDPNGKDVVLNVFSQEAFTQFKNEMNNLIGTNKAQIGYKKIGKNQYKMTLGFSKGYSAEKLGSNSSGLSQGSRSAITLLNQMISDHGNTVNENITLPDKNVETGSYRENKIDMADVMQWPEFNNNSDVQNGPTRGGKLMHELVEQYMKTGYSKLSQGQWDMDKFMHDHSIGVLTENQINGNTRTPDIVLPNNNPNVRFENQGTLQIFKLPGGTRVSYLVTGTFSDHDWSEVIKVSKYSETKN